MVRKGLVTYGDTEVTYDTEGAVEKNCSPEMRVGQLIIVLYISTLYSTLLQHACAVSFGSLCVNAS